MPLPANFQFSQASLSDYTDCARRFQLRHVLQLAWPAVDAEPIFERERLLALGQRFHGLIQQHVEGVPLECLQRALNDAELTRWWQHYQQALDTTLCHLPARRRAEVALTMPIGACYRLVAKCDLIAADADRVVIVDWKTEHRRATREQLRTRLQTRVYRYIVTTVQQRAPGTVSMMYWFAEYPDQPAVLPYDAAQHAADHQFLNGLIAEIAARGDCDGEWEKSANDRHCAYCIYRSLCNRGTVAGALQPGDEDEIDIDVRLADVDEIAY